VDARKQRYGAEDLPQLFRGARRLFIGKGKSYRQLDLTRATTPADLAAALGPSGNLRAPAARVGTDWLVGFCEEAWAEVLH